MQSDLEQLYNQMAQVAREFQQIQTRWDELLRQVQQVNHELLVPFHGAVGYGTPTLSNKTISSYGAGYVTEGHPYGTSEMARQSEHTSYGRMM
jgi:hypothetical protein